MANCWLHAFRAVRLSRTEARVIFARLSSDTLLCEYEELLRDTQLYSGRVIESGEVRERVSKRGCPVFPMQRYSPLLQSTCPGVPAKIFRVGGHGRQLGK